MSTTHYDDIERQLKTLDDEPLCPDNVAAIRTFIDATAAEGIGESQQLRLLYSLKTLLKKYAPDEFRLVGASKQDLQTIVAQVNRTDEYAEATKEKFRAALKKFYKLQNGGHDHPEKVQFFTVHRNNKPTSVTRDDLFTEDELTRLFQSFSNTRDRALTMALFESAARPGELLNCSIADFTANEKGDFIFLEGLKHTPDRTNQLVRAGRPIREWLAQHPCGGDVGSIADPTAPLWVKTEQLACTHCGETPQIHGDACSYDPNPADALNGAAYRRRFKQACERAGIPENKRRPYNLRHTRLTEVATFMGYEQLNKFAGWTPGSDRAKVYVHLNNDDVNKAIRTQYGLTTATEATTSQVCAICGSQNQAGQTECRTCARPLSLEHQATTDTKLRVLERLADLEGKGVLDELDQLSQTETTTG